MKPWTHEDVIDSIRNSGKVKPNILVTTSSLFEQDLGIDSLDLVGILLDIQDDFGFEWTDKEISSINSVADIINLLSKRSQTNAA
ncbi:MAG: acyl carrier protein [Isosphaeraceae bacterium]